MSHPTPAKALILRSRSRTIMGTLLLLQLLLLAPAWAGEPADLDGDGIVGFSDFLMLSRRFNTDDPLADIDGSGTVAFADFLILSTAYDAVGLVGESLPVGELQLIINEDLTVALRNPTASDANLLGFSLASPNGNFGTGSVAAPFSIRMANSITLQDAGNLANAFTLPAGEQTFLSVELAAAFSQLPDDLQFRYGLDDSDVVYTAPITMRRAGDVNLDGFVGFTDFIMLSRRFNQADPLGVADLDGNGTVAFADFLILSSSYDSVGQEPSANLPQGSITLVMDETEGLSIRNDGSSDEMILGCSLATTSDALANHTSTPFTITMLASGQGHDAGNLGNAFVLAAGASAALGASWTQPFVQLPGDLEFRVGLASSDEIQSGEIEVIRLIATTRDSWGALKSLYGSAGRAPIMGTGVKQ